MMNIGFDAKRAFNNSTGLGNYSRTLIEGLVKYFPENHYHLFTPFRKNNFIQERSNIQVYQPISWLHRKFPFYWRSFSIPDIESRAGLKIYHGLSNELPFAKSQVGVKQVVTIHDLIFLKYPHYYPLPDRIIYERKARHSCNLADIIIAVSEQTKRDLTEWMPSVGGKIKVVYQSCNPRFEKEISNEELQRAKQKYNLPDNYILYVGALSERKNLLNLVKAFHEISKETDAHLLMVGDGGSYKSKITELIQSLNLKERARIIFKAMSEDLPAIYRTANLFVYPSVYEGFGIPIIEALFSKVPVVTTRGGCFAEAGGPHSLYVDSSSVKELAKGMASVLQEKKLREKMTEDGYKYVQRFRQETTAQKLMELYSGL